MNERSKNLDYLKALCIIFVITVHFEWSSVQKLQYLFPYWIDMAVPFFMLISGYVNTASCIKRQINSLDNLLSCERIIKQYLRFTVPFLIFLAIEFLLIPAQDRTLKFIIQSMFTGGLGKGSYYYPLMIQFIFVFPFIYKIITAFPKKGLLITFAINMLWEISKLFIHVTEPFYRLIIFRYIFLIAFGCYCFINKDKKLPLRIYLYSLAGMLFIYAVTYRSISIPLFPWWTRTTVIATLYILPIFKFITDLHPVNLHIPFDVIGKISYEILFVQMLYYKFFCKYVYAITANPVISLPISIVLCIIFGYIFHLVSQPLTQKVTSSILKHNQYLN